MPINVNIDDRQASATDRPTIRKPITGVEPRATFAIECASCELDITAARLSPIARAYQTFIADLKAAGWVHVGNAWVCSECSSSEPWDLSGDPLVLGLSIHAPSVNADEPRTA